MEITFTCPHCGEVTLMGEEFVGQTGECRACGKKVTVPAMTSNREFAEGPPAVRHSRG